MVSEGVFLPDGTFLPLPNDLLPGPKRNFQIFDPSDFLAEVTQHIPEQGEHLIRYYGWYSNKKRGQRAKVRPQNFGGGLGKTLESPFPSNSSKFAGWDRRRRGDLRF